MDGAQAQPTGDEAFIRRVEAVPMKVMFEPNLETNPCNPSCAKPNGVRAPAYGGVQLQSICQHMNNIPWFDSP